MNTSKTTFLNISADRKEAFLSAATTHFDGVLSSLSFWEENGHCKESHEFAEYTRSDLLEHFEGDRESVRDVEAILNRFDEEGDFYDYGLCFDFVAATEESDGYYRFQICWGGPSSEIRFYADGTIEAVYLDWFCGVGYDVSTTDSFEWLEREFKDVGMIDFDSKDFEEVYKIREL